MKLSNYAKAAFGVAVLLLGVFYFRGCRSISLLSSFERTLMFGDVQSLEKELKADPSLANKRIGNFDTPLNRAVHSQHPKEAIDLLIKYGADINAKGWPFDLPPLLAASWAGKTDAVKALLAHKPDVNATGSDGDTALNYALVADNKEIFNLLLAAGADINHGRSSLAECMVYAEASRSDWAEFLLSKGADPNRVGPGDRFAPLIQAVLSGATNNVAALLRYHADQGVFYDNGNEHFTPLALAMAYDHPDIALMIGKAVLQYHTNTVEFAAAFGTIDLLRELLVKRPDSIRETNELGFTPLHSAAMMGRADAAEVLLSAGANIDAVDSIGFHPLEWAAYAGCLPLVESLFAKAPLSAGNQLGLPLLVAIQQGNNDVAKFLLNNGADANAGSSLLWHGRTALEFAAKHGNAEAARLLLDHKASVDGFATLRLAVCGTSKETVELLLDHGARTSDVGDFKWAPFHFWALGTGDPQIADLLLARHADINAEDENGRTPLHLAVSQGQLRAVDWLLKHGANVNMEDRQGITPLASLKPRHGGGELRKDVADLLRRHGAKE